jgi:hypothetical protein
MNLIVYLLFQELCDDILYTVEPLITDTAGEFKFCPL